MGGIWGKNIILSIFGESHGSGIGLVIDGLPPGLSLDLDLINKELQRRAPGRDKLSSQRREEDEFEILSGYFNSRTTGTPLCGIIRNKDSKPEDYKELKDIIRPGHGDYPGYIKYKGFNDYRGGGHFSGRLTAPIVFAGAIAKQVLMKKNILIGSHIKRIFNIEDRIFNKSYISENLLREIANKDFPVIEDTQGKKMKEVIANIKNEKDSVGGEIETAILNIPPGLGQPFFHSIESRLSQMMFSIPSVKAIEFGSGFDMARAKGSQVKDEYIIEGDQIKTIENHNGGITGGISNGMPIVFNIGIKPTPSIGQVQRTVNIKEMKEIEINIRGRHDPCILPRTVPVVEGGTALVILDLLIEMEGRSWMS